MRVIWLKGNAAAGRRVVALGTFDGVHRGHQALIAKGAEIARREGIPLRVFTFDRHPLSVIAPGKTPGLLTTMPEKCRWLFRAGADEVAVIPFRRSMADMEPRDFLEYLESASEIHTAVAGWNYSFGRGGLGSPDMLREYGISRGFDTIVFPPVTMPDGRAVSSSEIRKSLGEGRLDDALDMLGHECTYTGRVIGGKHMGHQLGFPTANIKVPESRQLPKFGVYVCSVETESESWPGVVNIGIQPTLPSGAVTVEAHLLRGHPDLYGETVRLSLLSFIREERRFSGKDELRERIALDRAEAEKWFENGKDG